MSSSGTIPIDLFSLDSDVPQCLSLSLSQVLFLFSFFLLFCPVLFLFLSSSDDSSLVCDCYAFRLVKDDSIKNYAIEIQW